jgi:serine/threonine protein kinase
VSTDACPSADQLSQFALGTLPEPALETIARHLDGCSACEAAVRALDQLSDPVLAAIRHCPAGPTSSGGHTSTGYASLMAGIAGRPMPERLGDFRLVREIGRGGMGVVYEAEQVSLGRRVALKVLPRHALLDPDAVERFRRESRAAARLHHTNIVQVFGTGEQDGLHYFVMQLIPGVGLDALIRELGRSGPGAARDAALDATVRGLLSGRFAAPPEAPAGGEAPSGSSSGTGRRYWASVARIGAQVADALAFAHAHGIVHRDVKPSNLLLDPQGTVWVTDFGLAKETAGPNDLTGSDCLIGTLRYVPPERFRGRSDARGDVYGLGLVLYELLTCRPAFPTADRAGLLQQVMHAEPPRPRRLNPAIPYDLETVVLKATARDPAQRYPTAAELAEDLRRFVDDRPVRARRVTAPERLWRWGRRNPLPAGLLIAVTVSAALGLAHLSWLSDRLVRSAALDSAAQQADMLEQVNAHYSDVVEGVKRQGAAVEMELPAQFTINLGQRLSEHGQTGVQVRLYSDYPFRGRTDGGPHDDFEAEALRQLRHDPEQPYSRFEDFRGRPALRYAIARRMRESCVHCHNSHPDSTKHDWQVGDVRGVVEIIRPLDGDVARTRAGLRGTFALVAGTSVSLLGLSVLVLVVGNRRRATPH